MNENDTTQNQSQPEATSEVQLEPKVQTQEDVKIGSQAESIEAESTQSEPNQLRSRLISMLVLAVSLGVAGSVLLALILGQTLFSIFTKEPNDSIKALANQLTDYVYKTLQYLSFNSEERPFPYQAWDDEKEEALVSSGDVEQTA